MAGRIRRWKTQMPKTVTVHNAHVRRGVKPHEDDEQIAFFDIVRMNLNKHASLPWLLHTANQGTQSAQRGAKLKRMGVQAGVWDISLDSPSADGGHARLRIEMKVGTNGLSDDQVRWAWYYEGLPGGTRLAVCYSAEDAWDVVAEYLGLEAEDGRYARYLLS